MIRAVIAGSMLVALVACDAPGAQVATTVAALRGPVDVEPELVDGVFLMDEEGTIGVDGAAAAARDHGAGAYTLVSVDDVEHGEATLDVASGWIAFEPTIDFV